MTLLVPAGLAATALLVPLVLWYVLRARRPRRPVASTLLWRPYDDAATAAVPRQRFRPDRTFWLVAAAIVLGSLAVAQPAVPVPLPLGDHTVLVLDASGSMLADEGGTTRLDLARRAVRELAEQLGTGQSLSIVVAGHRARVLLSASADPSAARRALDRVDPTHGPPDLGGAFRLAAAVARPGEEVLTRLLTDGPLPDDLGSTPLPEGLVVDAVGEDRPNLAVTRLELAGAGPGAPRAFVQVRNLGPLPTRADLELRVDGSLGAGRRLDLAPRGTEEVLLPVDVGAARPSGIVEARIVPVGRDATGAAATDALAIDDAAWAVLPATRALRVLVVGPGNLFLETALAAAAPQADVARAATVPDDLAAVDLLVVDRADAPAQLRVPTLLVAPTAVPEGIELGGAPLAHPVITAVDASHPLSHDVDLSGVAIADAQQLDAPALQPVVSGPDGPLVLAGRLGSAPVAVVAFDLLRSNLPLEVAFPVLVANAVGWLVGAEHEAPATAGRDVRLTVPPGATGAVATPPDGGADVTVDAARPVLPVPRTGVWRLAWVPGDGTDAASLPPAPTVAVNPEPAEADLARGRPASAPPAGTPGAAAGAAQAEAAATRDGRRTFGRELLAAVVALLVVEALLRARDTGALGVRARARAS